MQNMFAELFAAFLLWIFYYRKAYYVDDSNDLIYILWMMLKFQKHIVPHTHEEKNHRFTYPQIKVCVCDTMWQTSYVQH